MDFKNKVVAKDKDKETQKPIKTKLDLKDKYNLYLTKAIYDKETNDFHVIIDNKIYPLLWDTTKIRFVVLYSLPTNEKRECWTGVEYDLKYTEPEKLEKILKHWSPVKDQQEVYVVLYKDSAILTKSKNE